MAERYFIDLELFHKIRFDFDIASVRDAKYTALRQFLISNGIGVNDGRIKRINQIDVQAINEPTFVTTIEHVVEIN